MILYTHNNKLIKIKSGLNAGKLIEKYVEPPPSFDEVTIGSQTWMAKNLTISDGGDGILSGYMNYGQGDVVEYYYTWDAAVRVAASIPGWHLPTKEEWETLANQISGSPTGGGNKLKSTYGWEENGNGDDEYGFTALPGGVVTARGLTYSNYRAYFWSATEKSSTMAWQRFITNTSDTFYRSEDYKTYYMSVRLIKDQP